MLNLEHESKTLITKEEFTNLITKYELANPIEQHNIYLETNDQYYRKQNGALRIRAYNNEKFELTLKLKDGRTNQEYNFALNQHDFQTIAADLTLPDNINVPIELKQPNVQYTTITKRYKLEFKNHIIEIDETSFESTIDYEIEVEAASIKQADLILTQFLKQNNIQFRASKPKIARYFDYNPQN